MGLNDFSALMSPSNVTKSPEKKTPNPQLLFYECFSDMFFNNFSISFVISLDPPLTHSTMNAVYSSGLASPHFLTWACLGLILITSRACDVLYFLAQLLPIVPLSLCLTRLSITRWPGSFLVGFLPTLPGLTQLPLNVFSQHPYISLVSVMYWPGDLSEHPVMSSDSP